MLVNLMRPLSKITQKLHASKPLPLFSCSVPKLLEDWQQYVCSHELKQWVLPLLVIKIQFVDWTTLNHMANKTLQL